MHIRNPYRIPPDFAELSDSYEKLKPHLITDPASGRTTIDFKDEEAQRRLTEAIMLRDFGVTLHIPLTRLCPPVPNRLNYALWVQDIVRAHEIALGSNVRPIRGIDIGTGSTAIYPFLLCNLEPIWEMVATELDDQSYESALNNVSQNDMQTRIHVEKASPDGLILFPLDNDSKGNFEFMMCNPPFYGSAGEVAQSAQGKELPPNAVCTGADIEMIYPEGGEEGFVGRIVKESESFQTRCKWYTSMLGKMSSVVSIVKTLHQHSITNYAITEFMQGQTRRWAIAWSFTDSRLPDSLARIPSVTSKHALYSSMPPRNTLTHAFPGYTMEIVHSALSGTLRSVESASCTEINHSTTDTNPFLIEARENTWSRSARRSRSNRQAVPSEGNAHQTASGPALTCSCRIIVGSSEDGAAVCAVEIQWIFGKDRSLFEGFAGHVGRKVGSALCDVQ